MAGDETKIKMMTVEETNAALPRVRLLLKSLREKKAAILRVQAQMEIEEMTGTDSQGQTTPSARAAITQLMEAFHHQSRQWEDQLEELFQMGAHLKDLDSGLVDFYSRRGSEVVFLCWKEGEANVRFWHPLQGGFQNRKPL